jgi:tRNA-dihydrouridine synthase B
VVGCGAGAGLLKDPEYLQQMVTEVVNAVDTPVTVKTRIGWDSNSIHILDIAKRLEDSGIQALTVHCRTRMMGHKGDADWSWIPKIKEVVDIPVVLNGNVLTAQDVKKAFDETNADGVMIARGAIGNPWIFSEAKDIMSLGYITDKITEEKRIETCLKHLKIAIEVKGLKRGVLEHRKYYSGYLKGMYLVSQVKQKLMTLYEFNDIEDVLLKYLELVLVHKAIKTHLQQSLAKAV